MTLDQLCHQPVQSTATGGHELKDVFAFPISFKRPLDGLDLTLDTTGTGDHFCFTFGRV